jgi:transaldolase
MSTLFTGLAAHTQIGADTGDLAAIRAIGAKDCTTNPTLILKAAQDPAHAPLLDDAVAYARARGGSLEHQVGWAIDKVAVNFGAAMCALATGFVCTEVDIRLSFDTAATVARSERLIDLYREAGADVSKVLIKVAATWEGVAAARILKARGIECNVTLVFSVVQAALAAEAGAFMIAPYVGRVTDWYKARGIDKTADGLDPGVANVAAIYNYLRKFGYPTRVMGASFRGLDQVLALAGCDHLTIGPALLAEMAATAGAVPRRLGPTAPDAPIARVDLSEPAVRWALLNDPMAYDLLGQGMRGFAQDTETLSAMFRARLQK